jgi:hypothetical protein
MQHILYLLDVIPTLHHLYRIHNLPTLLHYAALPVTQPKPFLLSHCTFIVNHSIAGMLIINHCGLTTATATA